MAKETNLKSIGFHSCRFKPCCWNIWNTMILTIFPLTLIIVLCQSYQLLILEIMVEPNECLLNLLADNRSSWILIIFSLFKKGLKSATLILIIFPLFKKELNSATLKVGTFETPTLILIIFPLFKKGLKSATLKVGTFETSWFLSSSPSSKKDSSQQHCK